MKPSNRTVRRSLIVSLAMVALLALAWWTHGESIDWEWITEQEKWSREAIVKHQVVSPVVGLFVYVILSLIPGTAGKAIVYGWLFGFWIGLLISSTALTIAAVVSCSAVRYLFRDIAQARLSRLTHIIDRSVSRDGAMWLVTLRLLHSPYTLTNYASGATAIPMTTFAWTTQLGMLPGTIVFALAGSRLPSLHAVADQGIWGVVDIPFMVLLSLLTFLPFLRRLLRRKHPPSPVFGT